MAPGKSGSSRSLADQIADLDDPTPKDFDPEDLDYGEQTSDDENDKDGSADAGREHYEAVGKGKLRKQDPIALGKQYSGSRVSREALEAESDDDPFKARSSEDDDDDQDQDPSGDEDDSDLNSQEEIEEMTDDDEEDGGANLKNSKKIKDLKKQRRPRHDAESVDEEESDGSEKESEGDLEASVDGSDDDNGMDSEEPSDDEVDDEDEDDSVHNDAKAKRPRSDDREELRRLMASDQKTVTASISQAAKADAAKGKAVKEQRATFDALLNTRIKLQKGLTAINGLSATAKDTEDTDEGAVKSAESAALTLWSTLEDLRLALADAQTKDDSKKRKRSSPVSPTISTSSLWERMADLESESVIRRRAILDKWSLKVRGTSATLPNARGKLLGPTTGAQQTVTAVLDAQVASETGERAAKRSRKEAKPNGASGHVNGDSDDPEPIYDDTVFYQSLLRDLVEQRMSSSDSITNGLDTLHLNLPSRLSLHPVTGMRKDKVKKPVDTRASKGRQIRYDVHEKLQNFMAPENRGTWTNRARDEFFASLLGRTASGLLREDEGSSSEENDEEDIEEGGLRLFRN